MAINMPASAKFASVRFSLISNTQSFSSPLTGTTQTLELPGSKWQASFNLPVQVGTENLTGEWQSFLIRLRGQAGRFLAYDPARRIPRGALGVGVPATEGPNQFFPSTTLYPSESLYPEAAALPALPAVDSGTVLNTAPIGATTIDVTGLMEWDASQGVHITLETFPILKPGDYFQVGSELKMVVDYVFMTGGSTGTATIGFEPPLRKTALKGQKVTFTNPICIMRLVDDNQSGWGAQPAKLYNMAFDAVESFS